MVSRSSPMPKAKPMYFSGSSPMLRTTFGRTWPEPATSTPRAASRRAGLKPDVDLGAGLREGEKTGAKAQHQIIAFKKPAAKAREDGLQVLEAHVLADPQALALVEHRRVRGVAVDAVGAARGDH